MRYDLMMIEISMRQFANFTPKNIVEIGSRDGHDTDYMRRMFNLPEDCCYIFEAHPDCYSMIGKNYPGFNLFNCAITDKTGVVQFNAGIVGLENNIGGSSMLKDVTGNFKSNVVSVDGWRFDEVCSKLELQEIDLIKIDVEGHTKEVLDGFGVMLDKTKAIQVELEHKECWEGQALYEDIKKYLLNNNFIEVFFIRHAHDQSDSFWIKDGYCKR